MSMKRFMFAAMCLGVLMVLLQAESAEARTAAGSQLI